MMNIYSKSRQGFFKKFPGQFWLVVMFEFFERGAYYGMMSFLSQYFVEFLHFSKENVGIIKGVIQPLLYFLPIIAGALADRFGYRKVLMVAFTLLGSGYFLTSQMTSYPAVFAAMVVMGFGAGAFKPIVSGAIAKITDESNSTEAFGVYYWSINMGAFLFPLILVPFLKSIRPSYVVIASAICTATMIIPTIFFFKEPNKQNETERNEKENKSLLQILANAFEIIYSPIVLIYNLLKKSFTWKVVVSSILILFFIFSFWIYMNPSPAPRKFSKIGIEKGNITLLFNIKRDMLKKCSYEIKGSSENEKNVTGAGSIVSLTIYKPGNINKELDKLLNELNTYMGAEPVTADEINYYIKNSNAKIELSFVLDPTATSDIKIENIIGDRYRLILNRLDTYEINKANILAQLHKFPALRGITIEDCDMIYNGFKNRPFFPLFVVSLVLIGLLIVSVSIRRKQLKENEQDHSKAVVGIHLTTALAFGLSIVIWFIPGLDILGRLVFSVIYFSVMSLFIIDKSDSRKFIDHGKFLLMIVLYSGFWVLYFQMLDSVLWYAQAYVDAGPLNRVVNRFLDFFGIHIHWFFDVEHVTVIAAGTIILLQLFVSRIVKNKKAMPTLIVGIGIGSLGMAILALSTNIWIFVLGIFIFSIGEMTVHPKFISYIGLTAPVHKKTLYMGYVCLYG
ncbi:MAG: MFS transporter, partial [Acidobacteria bacterium]|nr:MFS transporter [Acidobacteriota bacterium]